MQPFFPMRELPNHNHFGPNDVLVLIGELFQKGYANGLVNAAREKQMKIIYSTVGRRTPDNTLRPLNAEELQLQDPNLINIPLEAGFDLETPLNGVSPVDQMKNIKLTDWESSKLDWDQINLSQKQGQTRFRSHLTGFLNQLKPHLKPGSKVIFAHLMAGGIPRAKILMPLFNRIFKGQNDRYLSSKLFWDSELGKLCGKCFSEVTAWTFKTLLEESQEIQNWLEKNGGYARYLAFGYHGTEVHSPSKNLFWQAYPSYLQGWAKNELESYSNSHSVVFNCPEIMTSSSSIFVGVEITLYCLIRDLALSSNPHAKKMVHKIAELFKQKTNQFPLIYDAIDDYFSNPIMADHKKFELWPQHNSPEQMKLKIETSELLESFHTDIKHLASTPLSEMVIASCGKIILDEIENPRRSVTWLGHDILMKALC